MSDIINYISQYIRAASIMDVIDILIVAYLLYRFVRFMRNTAAGKVVKGFIFLLIIMQVSKWMELNTINYLLEFVMKNGIIAVIIVFQPEIRKALEQVGNTGLSKVLFNKSGVSISEWAIKQTVEACASMAKTRTGALIVFKKNERIDDILHNGTSIDAEVSEEIIKNIFYPKAPLHDGALIIVNGRIAAAGCVLPLSANPAISRDLGTRHRAAVGMSEQFDSVCVVVSEETGAISVAVGGMLKRHLTPGLLEKLLKAELLSDDDAVSRKTVKDRLKEFIDGWREKS